MPTMVMSHPPKSSGNVMRKRQKNKNDHIVPISYMYVGTPKKKFTFYVRERMVYRSNVEVTYDDVYNYLASTTCDETVSLHYSVNGQYIPIATTGQLHTFIRLVHNDPNAFLYVENQDYVWNVTPQSKGHKMEKRNPNGGAVTPPQDGEEGSDEMNDEEYVDSQEDTQGDGDPMTDDEELESSQMEDEDLEDEDEEETDEDMSDEEDPEHPRTLTCATARVVIPGKVALKEAFVEPKARVLTKTKTGDSSPSKPQETPSKKALYGEDTAPPSSPVLSFKCTTEGEAYRQMKSIISEVLGNRNMGSAPIKVAEQLVRDVWNPDYPLDEEVFKDTVDLLQPSVAAGLMHYYDRIIQRFDSETDADRLAKGPLDSLLTGDCTPSHDPAFLVEFLETATIAACDMLESIQHLAQLDREFEYFKDLNEKIAAEDKSKSSSKLPSNDELVARLTSAVTSAHYGFEVLKLVFPKGCACKNAIRSLIMELEKMLSILENVVNKTSLAQTISETKYFVIETLEHIVNRFTSLDCSIHENIKQAIEDAECFKWRKDTSLCYEQWSELRERGENRLHVPQKVHSTHLECPAPYAVKPTDKSNHPSEIPVADLGTCLTGISPLTVPLHTPESLEQVRQRSGAFFQPLLDAHKEKTGAAREAPQEERVAPETSNSAPPQTAPVSTPNVTEQSTATTLATDAAASTPATTSATGTSAGGGTATVSRTMSAELRKMIDNMYKSIPNQHNHVYPSPPKAGSILIPTGGLARCRCSKNCPEFLMEPAYEYVERFNEPRQTVWEKTKQKRFKKN